MFENKFFLDVKINFNLFESFDMIVVFCIFILFIIEKIRVKGIFYLVFNGLINKLVICEVYLCC